MIKEQEIKMLENKLNILSDIWINYFYSFPYFHNKVKFHEEERTNYIGIIFRYLQDSFDVVFATPPNEFNSYVDKFTYQIAFLQSIYVQQDLIEELLRVFKTGIERDTLNKDSNYRINRKIRNELVGHPISRNDDFSLRSSTTFGYEKAGNSIQYLKYEFPIESNVVQEVEISDMISRHTAFLETYLNKLLEKSYPLLLKFKSEVLTPLTYLLKKNCPQDVIDFCTIHLKNEFEEHNEIMLNQLIDLYENNSHPRYNYAFKLYWSYFINFANDKMESIDEILSKKSLLPKVQLNIKDTPKPLPIKFYKRNEKDNALVPFKRKNYNYELGKLNSKRNPIDFDFFSELILQENMDDQKVVDEIKHLQDNRNNILEFSSGLSYLRHLLETKLKETK